MYEYRAIITSVFDGDTLRANLHLGFGIVDQGSSGKGRQFRLYGINTPEVRGKEKEEGLKVRDYVRSLLPEGTEVLIKSIKDRSGKYGRYLAEIWINDDKDGVPHLYNLNHHLVEKGMAKIYMKN